MLLFFRVDCRLSDKRDSSGISPVDLAVRHIHRHNRVSGAAPFVFRPNGLIFSGGERVLNTYLNRAIIPSDGKKEWGSDFPFLSRFLENFLEPKAQLDYFLAWWKHFYRSAHEQKPRQGQNTFLMGPANAGKTFTSRGLVGASVGGFVDASNFLIKGSVFNSELFKEPLWCVDDEHVGDTESSRQLFSTGLKKTAANSTFLHNKKFEVPVMVEHMGRVLITSNLDAISSRVLVPMDDTSKDKTNLFRCSTTLFPFPDRYETERLVKEELPAFLRWLLDWEPPGNVKRDVRFGYEAHHEGALMKQSKQSSRSAPYKEIVRDTLAMYFADHPKAEFWRGSLVSLLRLIHTNPMNQLILKTERLEMSNRYLENLQRDGYCTSEDGEDDVRVWSFPNPSLPK
jgi:hypothetical protein